MALNETLALIQAKRVVACFDYIKHGLEYKEQEDTLLEEEEEADGEDEAEEEEERTLSAREMVAAYRAIWRQQRGPATKRKPLSAWKLPVAMDLEEEDFELPADVYLDATEAFAAERCRSRGSRSLETAMKEFEMIRRNVLVDRDESRWRNEDEALAKCGCDDSSCCRDASSCSSRAVMVECSPLTCSLGRNCHNRRLQRGHRPKGVVVAPAGEKGFGLFATIKVEVGELIGEYLGEVMSISRFTALCAVRREKHSYFMRLGADEVIDASRKAGLCRFVNHSCDPNCEAEAWTVNGERRVAIVAHKPIEIGEEFSIDYDWGGADTSSKPCYCNAPTCRGTLAAGVCGVFSDDEDCSLSDDNSSASERLDKVSALASMVSSWQPSCDDISDCDDLNEASQDEIFSDDADEQANEEKQCQQEEQQEADEKPASPVDTPAVSDDTTSDDIRWGLPGQPPPRPNRAAIEASKRRAAYLQRVAQSNATKALTRPVDPRKRRKQAPANPPAIESEGQAGEVLPPMAFGPDSHAKDCLKCSQPRDPCSRYPPPDARRGAPPRGSSPTHASQEPQTSMYSSPLKAVKHSPPKDKSKSFLWHDTFKCSPKRDIGRQHSPLHDALRRSPKPKHTRQSPPPDLLRRNTSRDARHVDGRLSRKTFEACWHRYSNPPRDSNDSIPSYTRVNCLPRQRVQSNERRADDSLPNKRRRDNSPSQIRHHGVSPPPKRRRDNSPSQLRHHGVSPTPRRHRDDVLRARIRTASLSPTRRCDDTLAPTQRRDCATSLRQRPSPRRARAWQVARNRHSRVESRIQRG